jgi:signal transduction histidine kinase
LGVKGERGSSPAGLVGGVIAVAVLATVAVTALPFLRFAYRAPAVHVMLETGNALFALVVGYLVYGRFAQNRRLQELLLVLAMCTVAIANLALAALPSAVELGADQEPNRWAALAIRLIGTLLLAGAAFVAPPVEVGRRRSWLMVGAVAAVVVVGTAVVLQFGHLLPPTVDLAAAVSDASGPRLVAHPAVLVGHGVGAVLYAAAAAAFTVQSARREDELLRWVAAGCVLAAFAGVHYLIFPSLYSDYVYTGDLLRSGFYLLIFIGAAREVRSYWQLRTRAAVLEDRRRMARDLHDGLAQELTYISAQTKRLAAHPEETRLLERISSAAGRALDEARLAIAALTRPVDEPFLQVLQRLTEEMCHRFDVKVVTALDPAAAVSADQAEALLRIIGEAIRNAVRHGGARRVEVTLTAEPLALTIADDGRGFVLDGVDAAQRSGFGLISMRERAESVGGELAITSVPGEGTTVQVGWP